MTAYGTSRRFVATHESSVAIEGIADIRRSLAARRSDALHVLAYNLTRVMNIMGIQPLMAAIRA